MGYGWLYVALFMAVLVGYVLYSRAQQRKHAHQFEEAKQAGMGEPPSLHPVIDPVRCLGSGSCVRMCPEEALGMVGGKAMLTNPAVCIGHGACEAACPFDAIQLVFGTATRGIEIPNLTPEFESDVPGIFIAGELGGMGLIRKAAEQGRQAVEVIRKRPRGSGGGSGASNDQGLDLIIVGAGPAGLSAGLTALEHKLRFALLEQEDSLGGTVYHYPRNKVAMTAPVKLALVGTMQFREVSKERLLEFWSGVVHKTGLEVQLRQRMTKIEHDEGGFVVHTERGQFAARNVLLTLGRRGTPRKLEVPGEEQAKVVYRLVDAEQYRGQAVLVVGGGDSALEAAIAIAREPGTQVTLSYRSAAFSRVKQKNRDALAQLEREKRLEVLLESNVKRIGERDVELTTAGKQALPRTLANDAVIVCAGGLLPNTLLQQMGIGFETKFGQR